MANHLRIQRLGSGTGERLTPKRFAAVVSGDPKATADAEFTDPSGRLKAGIAAYESSAIRLDGYPYDEYCFVLTGELIVTDADGTTETYGPGDAFLMPRGFQGTWNMPQGLRKYFVIFDAEKQRL